MVAFIKVPVANTTVTWRVNVDQIASYAQADARGRTTINLTGGGTITVTLDADQVDALLRDTGNPVFNANGTPI